MDYSNLVTERFTAAGIDPKLGLATMLTESGGNPNALRINKDGSQDTGLMQLNSSTVKYLQDKEALPANFNPADPEQNIAGAIAVIKDKFPQGVPADSAKFYTAYNGTSANVANFNKNLAKVGGVPTVGGEDTAAQVSQLTGGLNDLQQQLANFQDLIITSTQNIKQDANSYQTLSAESAKLAAEAGVIRAQQLNAGQQMVLKTVSNLQADPNAANNVLTPMYEELSAATARLAEVDKALVQQSRTQSTNIFAELVRELAGDNLIKEQAALREQITDLRKNTNAIHATISDQATSATAISQTYSMEESIKLIQAKMAGTIADMKKAGLETTKLELIVANMGIDATTKGVELQQKAAMLPMTVQYQRQQLEAGALALQEGKETSATRKRWIESAQLSAQRLGWSDWANITPETFKLKTPEAQEALMQGIETGAFGDTPAAVIKNMATGNVLNMDPAATHIARTTLSPIYNEVIKTEKIKMLKGKQQEQAIIADMNTKIAGLSQNLNWADTSNPYLRAPVANLLKEPKIAALPIAKELALRFGTLPPETAVSDDKIADTIYDLVRSKQLSAGDAAAQAAAFYRESIAFNNRIKKFSLLKMPEQKSYKTNIKNADSTLGVFFTTESVDLTSAAAWANLLAVRSTREAAGLNFPETAADLLSGERTKQRFEGRIPGIEGAK